MMYCNVGLFVAFFFFYFLETTALMNKCREVRLICFNLGFSDQHLFSTDDKSFA